MGKRERTEREQVIQFLLQASDGDFVGVLADVFDARPVYPGEEHYIKAHFFLGRATLQRVADNERGEQVWQEWSTSAVAAVNAEDRGLDFKDNLHQEGMCMKCGTSVVSYAKRVSCPVCGEPAHCT